jgi:ribosomal protein L11 methyltransferase
MNRSALWRLSVSISPAAEEAVSELLGELAGVPAAVWTNLETGRTEAQVYLPAENHALHRELAAGLRRLRDAGLDLGSGRISMTRLPRENWAESWKRHFKVLEIGRALLVKPSWSRRQPRRSQAVVVIDPGLSFGTGQHPTTAFCLEQLVARRDPARRQSFLDMGTGSGILAIAAAKLGYAPVRALDFDPEAVRVARSNARLNGVARRVRVEQHDVTKLPRHSRECADVLCANLLSTLLIAERDRIVSRVAPGGVLVLAGILKTEFADVERACAAAGLKRIASRAVREWRSGAFAFVRSAA